MTPSPTTRARSRPWAVSLWAIAHELLTSLKGTVTELGTPGERSGLRALVNRILRKCSYPPDLQDAAIQTVLQQAEALSAQWTA